MFVWTFAALRLFACISNGGYANMNALFPTKNSYRYSHVHPIKMCSQTGFTRLKTGRIDDEVGDLQALIIAVIKGKRCFRLSPVKKEALGFLIGLFL